MPQPAALAPNFCRCVHRVTSHLTKWPHCIPTLLSSHQHTPAHSVLTLSPRQLNRCSWCDSQMPVILQMLWRAAVLWLHHFSFAMLNPIQCLNQSLYWSSLSAFLECGGQVVTALETEASGKVCHSHSSHQLLHDSGTTISHQLTELEVTLSPLNSFTTYSWGCFSPTLAPLFPHYQSSRQSKEEIANRLAAEQDKHKVWCLHTHLGCEEQWHSPITTFLAMRVCTPWSSIMSHCHTDQHPGSRHLQKPWTNPFSLPNDKVQGLSFSLTGN